MVDFHEPISKQLLVLKSAPVNSISGKSNQNDPIKNLHKETEVNKPKPDTELLHYFDKAFNRIKGKQTSLTLKDFLKKVLFKMISQDSSDKWLTL